MKYVIKYINNKIFLIFIIKFGVKMAKKYTKKEIKSDIRKIIIIFVIAVLFAILVNVTIEAFYPQPQYEDFCDDNYRAMAIGKPVDNCQEIIVKDYDYQKCQDLGGQIEYKIGSNGCPTSFYCETCYKEMDNANEKYNFIVFIVSAISGLIAVFLGLYLPKPKNPINEWVGSGFLLGGLFTLFVGTVRFFGDMGRYYRPLVILIELILVIWLTYKKLGEQKKK